MLFKDVLDAKTMLKVKQYVHYVCMDFNQLAEEPHALHKHAQFLTVKFVLAAKHLIMAYSCVWYASKDILLTQIINVLAITLL
jgi:hypothetical protein